MLNLVIATDDLAIWNSFSAETAGSGASPQWAASGLEAIELVEAGDIDLLLLDINVTIFSAWEVCDALRNTTQVSPDLPIYIMTDDDVSPHTLDQHRVTGTLPKSPAAGALGDLLATLALSAPH